MYPELSRGIKEVGLICMPIQEFDQRVRNGGEKTVLVDFYAE
jgi:hypothetical protein